MPKVLRVKDPHDSYHVKKELFDLPMSMIIVGKSQLSGKSSFVLGFYAALEQII